MKSLFYRVLRKIFKSSTSKTKRTIYAFLRSIPFYEKSLRKDFPFRGEFKVNVKRKKSFLMINYGGFIEEKTFWDGLFKTWENDVGWIWKELCEHAEVIFDIGANNGIYTLTAKAINPAAKIYAFEPSVHHFSKLKRNIQRNNYKFQFEKIAVSNKTSEEVFYDLPDPNRNTASLSPDKMKNLKSYNGKINEYLVETTTLSNYIEKHGLEKIDLIKLDIELYEPEAIEGLGKYLELYKPIIIIEVLTQEVAERLNKIVNLNNHMIFHLKKEQKAEKKEKFSYDRNKKSSWEWNYIFFHKSKEGQIRQTTTLF